MSHYATTDSAATSNKWLALALPARPPRLRRGHESEQTGLLASLSRHKVHDTPSFVFVCIFLKVSCHSPGSTR